MKKVKYTPEIRDRAVQLLIESEKDVSYVPADDQVVEKVVKEKEETTEPTTN